MIHRPNATGLLAAVLVVFVFTAHSPIPAAITITVFGAAGFATTVSTVMQSNFTHIYQAELFHTARLANETSNWRS